MKWTNADPFNYVGPKVKRLFWARVNKTGSCWVWTGSKDKDGYGMISARLYPHKSYPFKAHRLSWFLEHGDPGKMLVCHHCDNPPCVNPKHLFLATPRQNTQDMMHKNRNRMPPNTILSYKIAESIRKRFFDAIKRGAPVTQRKLASMYGVRYNAIWKIINNKSWLRPLYKDAIS